MHRRICGQYRIQLLLYVRRAFQLSLCRRTLKIPRTAGITIKIKKNILDAYNEEREQVFYASMHFTRETIWKKWTCGQKNNIMASESEGYGTETAHRSYFASQPAERTVAGTVANVRNRIQPPEEEYVRDFTMVDYALTFYNVISIAQTGGKKLLIMVKRSVSKKY
ncbi:Hypothetical protein CINCED_3A018538 [Cinara cedri]|uniref:Uncharacterized protein n=1 Tax=Cinara cedri TaxID=506608 RepID=A0A5E4NR02_9HEMI|nr:Hypothetical protein CINCED_3A018538 [Cinara cedri]